MKRNGIGTLFGILVQFAYQSVIQNFILMKIEAITVVVKISR